MGREVYIRSTLPDRQEPGQASLTGPEVMGIVRRIHPELADTDTKPQPKPDPATEALATIIRQQLGGNPDII